MSIPLDLGIDPADCIRLAEAARYFAGRRGRRVSVATLFSVGPAQASRGVRLRTIRIGQGRYTAEAWVREFVVPSAPSPSAERHSRQSVADSLSRAGLCELASKPPVRPSPRPLCDPSPRKPAKRVEWLRVPLETLTMSATSSETPSPTVPGNSNQLDVVVAGDTEFQGPHTLTTQFATRRPDGTLITQIYYSPAIPPPPITLTSEKVMAHLRDQLGGRIGTLILRPAKALSPTLSPAMIVADLLTSAGVTALDPNPVGFGVHVDPHPKPINIELVGHSLHVDFARLFGRDYWSDLLGTGDTAPSRRPQHRHEGDQHDNSGTPRFGRGPIIDTHALPDGRLLGFRLVTRDLKVMSKEEVFDALSRVYLGVGKAENLTSLDKEEMDRVFTERTEEAYIYAIIDVILTLLLREAVAVVDRQTETDLRLPHPPLASSVRGTVGARAKDILSVSTAAFAADSIVLSKPSTLRRLTQAGGRAALIKNGPSKYRTRSPKSLAGT